MRYGERWSRTGMSTHDTRVLNVIKLKKRRGMEGVEAPTQSQSEANTIVRPANQVACQQEDGRKAPTGFQGCLAAPFLVPHVPTHCKRRSSVAIVGS
jgi:hypothetical protein